MNFIDLYGVSGSLPGTLEPLLSLYDIEYYCDGDDGWCRRFGFLAYVQSKTSEYSSFEVGVNLLYDEPIHYYDDDSWGLPMRCTGHISRYLNIVTCEAQAYNYCEHIDWDRYSYLDTPGKPTHLLIGVSNMHIFLSRGGDVQLDVPIIPRVVGIKGLHCINWRAGKPYYIYVPDPKVPPEAREREGGGRPL